MIHLFYIYWLFLKIGLFTFGGGYAMIPLFQMELVEHHQYLTDAEFANIVALAQMTPGPVGLNAATYIGYQQGIAALGDVIGIYPAGCLGALFGTLGVMTPSLTIVLAAAVFLAKFQENKYVKAVLSGIRPAMLGLIGAAVIFFANTSIFTAPLQTVFRKISAFGISWQAFLIFGAVLFVEFKYKVNIIFVIIGSGLAAWLLYMI
ncbi:MAG: chromate transporter [Lentisphaerae bacterium]|nr:chromate transporter [Lentisphaerota bacterium]